MRLRMQKMQVAAPRNLVFAVLSGGERKQGTSRRFLEFETRWRGRKLHMGESVTFQAPDRISYRWSMGPLLEIEEEVVLEESGFEKTVMTFVGRFEPPKGVLGWLRGATVVRSTLDRFVHNYIAEGKLSAESLFVPSRVAPIT